MARANSNNGDKGTYGRIMKNGKKKKATNSSTTPKIKKISNNSSSSRKKVPPKSKHHIAKLSSSNNKRRSSSTSIKERVAASSSASSLKKKKKSSKKLKYPGHSAPCPISKTSRKKAKKKKKGGSSKSSNSSKRHQYQMTISECNNDVYLQRVNCPWYDDAQLDDTSTTQDNNNNNKQHKQSSTNNNNTLSSIQLPNETILNQIDTEIHTFTTYVKLTPNEHKARLAFIKHVTELSVDQFEKNGNYKNNNSSNSHYRFDGMGVTSTLQGGGRRKRSSNRCDEEQQEEEEEEETIHVAPFGSFATQQVCTFASDVDMCLWGVVKGAPSSKKNVEVFIGDDDSNDDDDDNEEEEEEGQGTDYNKNKNDGDKRRREKDLDVILDNGSFHNGCPLLTESSLLRTMDAIQQQQGSSASAAAAAVATKTKGKKDDGVTRSKATTAAGDKGDLFFIDRVGEARPDAIDLCNTNNDKLPYVQPPPSQPVKSDNIDAKEGKAVNKGGASASVAAAETDFQFVLDTRGVGQELGGKVEDVVTESSSSNNNADDTPEESSPKDCHQLDKTPEMKSTNDEAAKEGMDTKTDNSNSNLKDDQNDKRDTSDHEEEESEVIVIDSDNSDDDSADKMSSYYNRQKNDNSTNNVEDDRVSEARAASSSVILLDDDSSSAPSSSDEDEDGKVDLTNYDDINSSEDDARQTDAQIPNEVLELSITSNRRESSSSITRGNGNKPSFGPTGKTRIHVISALQSLTRQLRRSSFTHTIECRSKARVPIINCSTRTGFEGDIAIGGHNGVDTSMYALSQVKRFRSFAPIVLILKVLMAQQGFDKPFTGGLGSYKLYVLVAYHIDCHLANGGNDRPSEILISLFFRYGCCSGKKRTDKAATTDLEQLRSRDDFVSSDGGLCELTPVFRLSDCVDMFRECHGRLTDRILIVDDYDGHNENKISFLSSIIDCYRLREARETSNRRAKLCDSICRPIAHNDAGKVNPGRRIGMVFSKNGAVRDHNNNMQRGPRGGIVPRTRPDIQAKKALRGNREAEIIQRGMKNRKNNKKQKRDSSLTGFASSQHF